MTPRRRGKRCRGAQQRLRFLGTSSRNEASSPHFVPLRPSGNKLCTASWRRGQRLLRAENLTRKDITDLGYRLAGLRMSTALLKVHLAFKAGFRPDQPRVPAGNPDGGEWTKVPGWARESERVSSKPERLEDLVVLVGGRGTRAGSGHVPIGGRLLPLTPNQQTRLATSQMELEAALQAVREISPTWKPQSQLYSTVEGLIGANLAHAREARVLREKWRYQGIGPGNFSGELREARSPARRFTREEREEVNRIGRESGCHTCGTRDPGTRLGNFIVDHQLPTGLQRSPARQSLLPHCLECSLRQGGTVRQIRRRK
jgi:hypothetical protein